MALRSQEDAGTWVRGIREVNLSRGMLNLKCSLRPSGGATLPCTKRTIFAHVFEEKIRVRIIHELSA